MAGIHIQARQAVVIDISSLVCGVCMQLFLDPRMLSCGHTFCRKCLQTQVAKRMSETEDKIVCALCRQVTESEVCRLQKTLAIADCVASILTENIPITDSENHGKLEQEDIKRFANI